MLGALGEHHRVHGKLVSALLGPLSMMHGNTGNPTTTVMAHIRFLLHFASNVLPVRQFDLIACLLNRIFSRLPDVSSFGVLYHASFTEVFSCGLPEKAGRCRDKRTLRSKRPQHVDWTLSFCSQIQIFHIEEALLVSGDVSRIFVDVLAKVATMQYPIHIAEVLS